MYNVEFDCRAETWEHRRQDEYYLFSLLFYVFIRCEHRFAVVVVVVVVDSGGVRFHGQNQLTCSPHNHNPAVPWYG